MSLPSPSRSAAKRHYQSKNRRRSLNRLTPIYLYKNEPPADLACDERSRERVHEMKVSIELSGEEAAAKWKHYMCDWKETWDKLAKHHEPFLQYCRKVWQEFDEREQTLAAACQAYLKNSLPLSHTIPGAAMTRTRTYVADVIDKEYCDRCHEVAWMLRHLYEEQRHAFGWPGPPTPPSEPPQQQLQDLCCLKSPRTPTRTVWTGLLLAECAFSPCIDLGTQHGVHVAIFTFLAGLWPRQYWNRRLLECFPPTSTSFLRQVKIAFKQQKTAFSPTSFTETLETVGTRPGAS